LQRLCCVKDWRQLIIDSLIRLANSWISRAFLRINRVISWSKASQSIWSKECGCVAILIIYTYSITNVHIAIRIWIWATWYGWPYYSSIFSYSDCCPVGDCGPCLLHEIGWVLIHWWRTQGVWLIVCNARWWKQICIHTVHPLGGQAPIQRCIIGCKINNEWVSVFLSVLCWINGINWNIIDGIVNESTRDRYSPHVLISIDCSVIVKFAWPVVIYIVCVSIQIIREIAWERNRFRASRHIITH